MAADFLLTCVLQLPSVVLQKYGCFAPERGRLKRDTLQQRHLRLHKVFVCSCPACLCMSAEERRFRTLFMEKLRAKSHFPLIFQSSLFDRVAEEVEV